MHMSLPQSMTGFGEARGAAGRVIIKSINAKDLKISVRGEPGWFTEQDIKLLLSEYRIFRGTIEIAFEHSPHKKITKINPQAFSQWAQIARSLSTTHNLEVPRFGDIINLPGVLDDFHKPHFKRYTKSVLRNAIRNLAQDREREGKVLSQALKKIIIEIEKTLELVSRISKKEITKKILISKKEATKKLKNLDISTQEKDRAIDCFLLTLMNGDITEELTRLETHCNEAQRILRKGGDCGRKLEFLVQEMGREANTLLSKNAGTESAYLCLTLKTLIEKIREQSLNLQ